MSDNLTPQQRLAVENRGGKLLVSAAAGSGKTKVLVDRLMSYLTDPVDPANMDDFLIITYTKAAASELRGKISDKLTNYIAIHPEDRHMHQQIQRLHMAKICTVHAFCADILREYAYRLDISADFRIAEENECQEIMVSVLQKLLDDAYTEKLQDESFLAFIDTQGLGRDDRQVPEIILQIYASAMCHQDPASWLNWCLHSVDVTNLTDASETVWGAYLIQDLMDYLDLQIHSMERCIDRIEDVPGMEKTTTLLKTTVFSLKSLRKCQTWDEIVKHPAIEYGTLTFKKEHKGTQLAEQVKAIRNNCKDNLAKKLRVFSDLSESVLAHLEESALASRSLVQLVNEFRTQYAKIKNGRHVLDFTDIEQKMLDLLYGKQRNGLTSVADEIGSRYREIMVDEYQDSNEVQDAIFSALTNKRQNCFMVGDVKQSIYQFRLADPGIFLEKYNTFQPVGEAKTGEGRKVLLSSNFRSSAGVISAVNDVFSACMSQKVGGLTYGEAEMLHEGISHISLNDPEVELYGVDVCEDTYQEEAAFVAQRITELLDGSHVIRNGDILRPITPDDIVILLRSPGSVGGEFRFALEKAGIPCYIGGDSNLLQMPEVESLHAILQVIHNPLQDIPLLAALASPVFGFTADDLALIRSSSTTTTLYQALGNSTLPKAISFISLLTEIRKAGRHLTISQLIHYLFAKTSILSIYGAMESGEEKVRNLQYFCQIASDYESTGYKDLTFFLSHLAALEQKGVSIMEAPASGAVRIMSIHKSKGLEFPVVFLSGLSRTFNMTDVQKQVLCHKDLGLGLVHTDTEQRVRFPTIAKRAIAAKICAESISEELRVLYVAMTRARDRLIMTYAAPKLDERLSDIALRLDLSDRVLLTSQVNCPGNWVLQTALRRTEAGAFFNIADKPDCSAVREHPWKISVVHANETIGKDDQEIFEENVLPAEVMERIRSGLAFSYPYKSVTQVPSKMTATQLKGRVKDQEAAEATATAQQRPLDFRDPSNRTKVTHGTDYGNTLHNVMQYLDLSVCHDANLIRNDIARMVNVGLLTSEQAQTVPIEKIVRFFQTDLGLKLMNAEEVLREFKFSIMEQADKYFSVSGDEQILLQGVVDCAILEKNGIVVLDFKTDYITQSNISEKIALYRSQVSTYANALSRIFEKPILASYIYFFSSEQVIEV